MSWTACGVDQAAKEDTKSRRQTMMIWTALTWRSSSKQTKRKIDGDETNLRLRREPLCRGASATNTKNYGKIMAWLFFAVAIQQTIMGMVITAWLFFAIALLQNYTHKKQINKRREITLESTCLRSCKRSHD
jgi:hypothetical protein